MRPRDKAKLKLWIESTESRVQSYQSQSYGPERHGLSPTKVQGVKFNTKELLRIDDSQRVRIVAVVHKD